MAATLDIVGRDEELAAISAFLEASDELPGALLLEGEAGIGKTTLWREGIAVARGNSYRVLSCTPGQAETQLSLAGLRDLLNEAFDEVAPSLPPPQRRALAIALLREEADGKRAQHGAIAAAFLAAAQQLARARPLLLAVDDVQWLDGPSAALLEFAARRLESDPVAVLLSRRVEGEEPIPLGLDRALQDRLAVVSLGPLSLGALHRVLQIRLGVSFPRPVMRRLQETSGGNPFFALELARALEGAGRQLQPGQPLPVPVTLHRLLQDRLGALSAEAREALAVAAALAEPTLATIEGILARPIGASLEPAVEAHLIELDGDRLRFTHPLFATAATAGRSARRDLHRRLAAAIVDPEEHARHLALASTGPDADVARALDEAAERALARGAPGAAADLLEQARDLTPTGEAEEWARRSLEAAEAHEAAGDEARGQALAREVVDRLRAGPLRARALARLGWWTERLDLCERALAEAGDDLGLRGEVHFIRAYLTGAAGDYRGARGAARQAVACAERARATDLTARALAYLAYVEAITVSGSSEVHLSRAEELERGAGHIRVYYAPATYRGLCLLLADDLDNARRSFDAQSERALEAGDEYSSVLLSIHQAEVEWRAGDWPRSRAYARDLIEFMEQGGEELQGRGVLRIGIARIETQVGELELGRADAETALAEAQALGAKLWEAKARALLGLLELSLGDYEAATGWLGPVSLLAAQAGVRDPNVLLVAADEIEALIGGGRLDEAEAKLKAFERLGRELDRPWILSTSARCRGLLLAARGDLSAAVEALDRAFAHHERLPMPFERARTLLALGQVQRRAKRRREARETLEQALAIFEELRALLWVEKTRAELARIGGRASSAGLTPTEQRVAALVAEGRSNKEVAAALFVSVKAVEANLSRIYAKLGVRSRSELAHRLSTDERKL